MARKTKLTHDCQQRILEALRVGATHQIACDYAGISHETFYTWLDSGATGKQPFLEFLEEVNKASGAAAVGWLAKIEVAANNGQWQAAAWKLERRYPQQYGRTVQEQHLILEGEGLANLLQMTKESLNHDRS